MSRIIAVLVSVILCVSTVDAKPSKVKKNVRPAPGFYFVGVVASAASLDDVVEDLVDTYGGRVGHMFRGEPWQGFSVERLPPAKADLLAEDPRVAFVEEDSYAEFLEIAPPPNPVWGQDRTNQVALPLDNNTWAGCSPASSVTIYVMDSGISDPGADQFGTRLINLYTYSQTVGFGDSLNHGTAVASIAAGRTFGVSGSARVANVKVASSGSSTTAATAAAAIRDVIVPHAVTGPKVVNMSLIYGLTTTGVSSLETEINAARNSGITFVVGAGNKNLDACTDGSPARMGKTGTVKDNGVITVGATYISSSGVDSRSVHPGGDGVFSAWYSSYGTCVDIFAPGTRVAALGSNGAPREFSGTSAATPYVTGAVARLLQSHWVQHGSAGITSTLPATIEAQLKGDATSNVIDWSTIGAGSPNLFLYRRLIGTKCRL